jgi:hypothetical protein
VVLDTNLNIFTSLSVGISTVSGVTLIINSKPLRTLQFGTLMVKLLGMTAQKTCWLTGLLGGSTNTQFDLQNKLKS